MEKSLCPQSMVVGRKENVLGIRGHDENQKPGDLKSVKGVGDQKATRNALVPVVNQHAAAKLICGTKGDPLCQDEEIIAKKKVTKQERNKVLKEKKGIQPSMLGNNQAFEPKFTIYCDNDSDNGSTDGVDDNMSLVDDENEYPVVETCQSVPTPLEFEDQDGDELPDDPSYSFESVEKSVVFSDDSFFSCGHQESDAGKLDCQGGDSSKLGCQGGDSSKLDCQESDADKPFHQEGDAGKVVPSENFKEYTWDIMSYLLDLEKKYRPEPDYMSRQPEVNTKMRNILVDWMVEVTGEYKLNDETLFLAVDYIDRFLSEMSIARSHFQLLGTASLFISSKYEEIYPPDINEFIFITDDTYTKEQVLKMEALILKVLNLHISTPTISYFLHRYFISCRTSKTVNNLAEYLCHLVLLDGQIFFKFYPSEIALAAVILAAHNSSEEHSIDVDFLSKLLDFSCRSSGLAPREFQGRINECMQELLHLQTHASSHPQQAIYTKYSSDRYLCVAVLPPLSRTPSFKMLQ